MYQRIIMAAQVAVLSLLLVACGGSSSSGDANTTGTIRSPSTPSSPTVKSGVFLDAAVAGLSFSSGVLFGVTDINGTFEYIEGELVTFSVGGMTLGSVSGAAVITPVDLVPGAIDETHPMVVNILRFLQSIDEDANLANGIQISEAALAVMNGRTIDFDQSESDFEQDTLVTELISDMTGVTVGGIRALVSIEDALSHFRQTLATLNVEGNIEGNESGNISEAAFFERIKAINNGIWRSSVKSDITTEFNEEPIYNRSRTKLAVHSLQSIVAQDDNSVTVDYCDLDGSVVESALEEDLDALFDEQFDASICASTDTQYFAFSDSHFGVDFYCDGTVLAAVELKKVSDEVRFSQGSLAFSSGQYDNLAETTQVCGEIFNIATTNETISSDPEFPFSEYDEYQDVTLWVVADYVNDQRVVLEMTFFSDLAGGVYDADFDSVDDTGQKLGVELSLYSPAFGGGDPLGFPVMLGAESGSVIIEEVSELMVSGRFEVTLFDEFGDNAEGDRISGRFKLDLR